MDEAHDPSGSVIRAGGTTVYIGICSCGWQSVTHRGKPSEAIKDAQAHKDWINAKSKTTTPPPNPHLPKVS